MDITGLISLAGTSAGAIGNATGAAKDLRDFIRGKNRLPKEVSELCLKIYDELLDAKRDQGQLEDRLRALQKELAKLDRFNAEATRYELVTTPVGSLVYALKSDDGAAQPHHYICANCYEDQTKSILQPLGSAVLRCPRCGKDFLNHPTD